ncbi:MAG: peptidoglycan binding domain-containing protein, partial [Raoultibacter sp.]
MTNSYDRNNRNTDSRRRSTSASDSTHRTGNYGQRSSAASGSRRKNTAVQSAASSRQSAPSQNSKQRQRDHATSQHAATPKKTKHHASSYPNQATLWTKNSGKASKKSSGIGSFFGSILMGIGRVLKAIIFGIGHFFAVALTWISRSKIAIFATVAVLVFVAIGLVDLGVNWGKVYPGVKIGEVDLSGKTADEAALLINTAYADRLAEKEVLIFANEEASTNIEQTIANNQNNALAEQQTVEEALANKTLWTATATSLSAQLDTEAMTQEALSVGREDGGIFERFSAMAFGHVIYPRATYDGEALEHLAVEIDAAIGIPRINFNIRMYADKAWVTDGRDGDMLNRDDFKNLLDSSFLAADGNQASFVAKTEYAPIQITREEAERTAAFV